MLDIAAGHGMFGITLAHRNPQMKMVGTGLGAGARGGETQRAKGGRRGSLLDD